MKNLIPLPYRRVSVQPVDVALDENAIKSYLLGREAYRRTDYIVLRRGERCAVVAVKKAGSEPLFSPITEVEVLATPDECVWTEDPAVDPGNPSQMAAKARALGLPPDATLIVQGTYEHVNFIHHPDPLVIRVVDVTPPEPPKLLSLAQKVLQYADLPAIHLELERIDLRALAAQVRDSSPAYLIPCEASGLDLDAPTFFLDKHPPRQDWTLIGCERSRQIHRHFYSAEPRYVEMCPRKRVVSDGPTLLKCCLLETGIEVEGDTAIVPWGADLRMVEEALKALAGAEVTR